MGHLEHRVAVVGVEAEHLQYPGEEGEEGLLRQVEAVVVRPQPDQVPVPVV